MRARLGLSTALASADGQPTFTFGLERILDGINALITQQRNPNA